ncbi:MAG: carboxypeptidase-like regulatory domain-containing protein, partial [Candidatus Sulfotelmatobacter sp.]
MPRTSLCMISSCIRILSLLVLVSSSFVLSVPVSAQDAATGAIHGTVVDLHDLRIPGATIAVVDTATGSRYSAISDAEGRFAIDLLPPGDYSARVVAQDMSPQITPQLHVDVGAAAELQFRLSVAGALEHVSVSGAPALVDTESTAVSTLLDERAIGDLPLNGRRFSDLMLLSPGVTQDPRSL